MVKKVSHGTISAINSRIGTPGHGICAALLPAPSANCRRACGGEARVCRARPDNTHATIKRWFECVAARCAGPFAMQDDSFSFNEGGVGAGR
jgi:hypothetical protein